MNAAAVLLATALVLACVGSVTIWRTSTARARRDAAEALWWAHTLTPNHDGHLCPHTHPDQTTERPVLADHYRRTPQ